MISIIVPFKNEEKNLTLLYSGIKESLKNEKWELILINDGSTDQSPEEAEGLAKKDRNVVVTHQRKNFGKGRALSDGFSQSKGDILAFMDADMQDDPKDLPSFIDKINEGYDFVNGWRQKRNDDLIRTLPSRIGNKIFLKSILQSKFHDINCGYKVMRREVLETISLYGDNFRFLPVFAEKEGFKTTEVVVHHNPRQFGVSKYGFFRRFSIFLDILTSYFLYRFREKPLHFFGSIGALLFTIGFIIALWLSIERLFFGVLLYNRPALLMAVLFIIIGLQILMTGIVAELIVYLRFNRKEK